jgi:hypothetical protein
MSASTLVTLKQLLEARPHWTERKVRRDVATRKIPFYKNGGVLLFDLEELDAQILATRVDPQQS